MEAYAFLLLFLPVIPLFRMVFFGPIISEVTTDLFSRFLILAPSQSHSENRPILSFSIVRRTHHVAYGYQ